MSDLKKKLAIDEDRLEDEWIEQASHYLEACELHAIALEDRDLKKSKLDIVFAELDSKVRSKWDKLGFESKPTEPQIKQWIVRQTKYRKADHSYIRANKHVNLMLGLKQAFEHRKAALGNLVSLLISGFYSEPNVRNSKFKKDIDRKKRDKKVRKHYEKKPSRLKQLAEKEKKEKKDGKKLS